MSKFYRNYSSQESKHLFRLLNICLDGLQEVNGSQGSELPYFRPVTAEMHLISDTISRTFFPYLIPVSSHPAAGGGFRTVESFDIGFDIDKARSVQNVGAAHGQAIIFYCHKFNDGQTQF